jgi:hypothetical protein
MWGLLDITEFYDGRPHAPGLSVAPITGNRIHRR